MKGVVNKYSPWEIFIGNKTEVYLIISVTDMGFG